MFLLPDIETHDPRSALKLTAGEEEALSRLRHYVWGATVNEYGFETQEKDAIMQSTGNSSHACNAKESLMPALGGYITTRAQVGERTWGAVVPGLFSLCAALTTCLFTHWYVRRIASWCTLNRQEGTFELLITFPFWDVLSVKSPDATSEDTLTGFVTDNATAYLWSPCRQVELMPAPISLLSLV